MRLLEGILLGASLAHLIIAFKVPANQPDGTYLVQLNDTGTPIHKLLNDTQYIEPRNPDQFSDPRYGSRLKRRQDTSNVNCYDYSVAPGDTDAANRGVDTSCGNGLSVGAGYSIYTKVGNVVAYFCNFSPQYPKICYASSRQTDSRAVTSECGRYRVGQRLTIRPVGSNVNNWLGWSYGYERRDADFC